MTKELKQRREEIYGKIKGVQKVEKKPEPTGKQEKFKSMVINYTKNLRMNIELHCRSLKINCKPML